MNTAAYSSHDDKPTALPRNSKQKNTDMPLGFSKQNSRAQSIAAKIHKSLAVDEPKTIIIEKLKSSAPETILVVCQKDQFRHGPRGEYSSSSGFGSREDYGNHSRGPRGHDLRSGRGDDFHGGCGDFSSTVLDPKAHFLAGCKIGALGQERCEQFGKLDVVVTMGNKDNSIDKITTPEDTTITSDEKPRQVFEIICQKNVGDPAESVFTSVSLASHSSIMGEMLQTAFKNSSGQRYVTLLNTDGPMFQLLTNLMEHDEVCHRSCIDGADLPAYAKFEDMWTLAKFLKCDHSISKSITEGVSTKISSDLLPLPNYQDLIAVFRLSVCFGCSDKVRGSIIQAMITKASFELPKVDAVYYMW